MDAIILKYEVIFKQSQNKPEEFLKEISEAISSKLARVATDAIHNSILIGLDNDEYFIQSIENLNVGSFNKLRLNLKKKN